MMDKKQEKRKNLTSMALNIAPALLMFLMLLRRWKMIVCLFQSI